MNHNSPINDTTQTLNPPPEQKVIYMAQTILPWGGGEREGEGEHIITVTKGLAKTAFINLSFKKEKC